MHSIGCVQTQNHSARLLIFKSSASPLHWAIFASPGDSKLTRYGLGLQGNWQGENNCTFGLELAGRNIAPLNLKTEKVAKTDLRAPWFWATLAWFPGTWAIFASPRDSKLTRDCLDLQGNGQGKSNCTFSLELAGRNIAPLNWKTKKTYYAHRDFQQLWFDLERSQAVPGLCLD